MSNEIPAAWYPQPDGSQRYWDGLAWTEHHHPAPQPVAALQPYVAPQQTMVASPAGYAQPYGQPVAAKSPGLALFASFLVIGLGQVLNGEVGKGMAFFFGQLCLAFFAFILSFVLIGFLLVPFLFAVWAWSMIDASQGAKRWNAAHGIIS